MAEQDEGSLIGYDPLAWLHDPDATTEETPPLPVELELVEEASSAGSEVVESEPMIVEACEVAAEQPVPVVQLNQASAIVLDSVQTIRNVAELHGRLLQALNDCNRIDIDASAVATIDTATLQLLLVLKQTAINLQKEVSIEFPSEKFIEAAGLLGLAEMLDVDQAFAGFF